MAPLLLPTQNWEQRRADKQRELQYQDQINRLEQAKVLQLAAQRQAFEEDAAKVRALPFLDRDKQKINLRVDEFEKAVAEKVRTKYNGDVGKYLSIEGASDKAILKRDIRNSNAYKNGVYNKEMFNNYLLDRKDGLTPRLINGRRFEEMYSDYRSGKVDRLDYRGGYKAPDDWHKVITGSYGNDRYTRQVASNEEVIGAMQISGGLNYEDALDFFKQSGSEKFNISYKWDARPKETSSGGSGIKGPQVSVIGTVISPENERTSQTQLGRTFNVDGTTSVSDYNMTTYKNLSSSVKRDIVQGLGFVGLGDKGASGTYAPPTNMQFKAADGTSIKGTPAAYSPNNFVRIKSGGVDKLYLSGSIIIDEDQAEENGIDKVIGYNHDIGSSAVVRTKNTFLPWKSDVFRVDDVLVEVDPNTLSEAEINNNVNLRTGSFKAPAYNALSEFYE